MYFCIVLILGWFRIYLDNKDMMSTLRNLFTYLYLFSEHRFLEFLGISVWCFKMHNKYCQITSQKVCSNLIRYQIINIFAYFVFLDSFFCFIDLFYQNRFVFNKYGVLLLYLVGQESPCYNFFLKYLSPLFSSVCSFRWF